MRARFASVLLLLAACTFPDVNIDDGATDCSDPDRDDDGHDALACGGDDCNDGQPDVHPGQTSFFEVPIGGQLDNGFDYDCNGSEDGDPSQLATCGGNASDCPLSMPGFGSGAASCGTKDGYGSCSFDLTSMSCQHEQSGSTSTSLRCR